MAKSLTIQLDPSFLSASFETNKLSPIYIQEITPEFAHSYEKIEEAKKGAPKIYNMDQDHFAEVSRAASYQITPELPTSGIVPADLTKTLHGMGVSPYVSDFVISLLVQQDVGLHIKVFFNLNNVILNLVEFAKVKSDSCRFSCRVDKERNLFVTCKADIQQGFMGQEKKIGESVITYKVTPQKEVSMVEMSLNITDEKTIKILQSKMKEEKRVPERDNPFKHPIDYVKKHPWRTVGMIAGALTVAILTPPTMIVAGLALTFFGDVLMDFVTPKLKNRISNNIKNFLMPVSDPDSPLYIIKPEKPVSKPKPVVKKAQEFTSRSADLARRVQNASDSLTMQISEIRKQMSANDSIEREPLLQEYREQESKRSSTVSIQ